PRRFHELDTGAPAPWWPGRVEGSSVTPDGRETESQKILFSKSPIRRHQLRLPNRDGVYPPRRVFLFGVSPVGDNSRKPLGTGAPVLIQSAAECNNQNLTRVSTFSAKALPDIFLGSVTPPQHDSAFWGRTRRWHECTPVQFATVTVLRQSA